MKSKEERVAETIIPDIIPGEDKDEEELAWEAYQAEMDAAWERRESEETYWTAINAAGSKYQRRRKQLERDAILRGKEIHLEFLRMRGLSPKVTNLTQHIASEEQAFAGVVEPVDKAGIIAPLTFEEIPTTEEIKRRAVALADIARRHQPYHAMIGGPPWLMRSLEEALIERCVTPLYAFSIRESKESLQEDGSVKKESIFRHKGFIEVSE